MAGDGLGPEAQSPLQRDGRRRNAPHDARARRPSDRSGSAGARTGGPRPHPWQRDPPGPHRFMRGEAERGSRADAARPKAPPSFQVALEHQLDDVARLDPPRHSTASTGSSVAGAALRLRKAVDPSSATPWGTRQPSRRRTDPRRARNESSNGVWATAAPRQRPSQRPRQQVDALLGRHHAGSAQLPHTARPHETVGLEVRGALQCGAKPCSTTGCPGRRARRAGVISSAAPPHRRPSS